MKRRSFLAGTVATGVLAACGRAPTAGQLDEAAANRLSDFIRSQMLVRHIPGLTACLIHNDEWIWQENFGYADLAAKIPMSADHIQNIASISKTVATVAAMQQVEAGTLSLDADVNEYLPFEFRHPAHPKSTITARMLTRHTSGIRDGEMYARMYACGDPDTSLADWVSEYFEEDGRFYNADENFAPWVPGTNYEYTNTTFGLLGHLVETASGMGFPEYCEKNIFAPLGMNATAWMLADLDVDRHVVPYSWVADGEVRGAWWGGIPLGVIRPEGPTFEKPLEDGYHDNCIYSHPNYPDGFLRMSLRDASTWATLWLADGTLDGVQVLRADTVAEMFRDEPGNSDKEELQGLAWHSSHRMKGMRLWGHGGSDPGVTTELTLAKEAGLAAVVFANTDGVTSSDFADAMLREGLAAI